MWSAIIRKIRYTVKNKWGFSHVIVCTHNLTWWSYDAIISNLCIFSRCNFKLPSNPVRLQIDDPIHVISMPDEETMQQKPPDYDTVAGAPPTYDDAIKLNPARLLPATSGATSARGTPGDVVIPGQPDDAPVPVHVPVPKTPPPPYRPPQAIRWKLGRNRALL